MSVSSPKSFTLIELLIVTPQRKLLRSFQRGKSVSSFTLIELLIVIGILAILVAAIVITLNPAQLLQEARDSKRVQDLSSLRSAIHTAEALSPAMSFGVSSTVYVSLLDTTTTCA
ncbi:MAG: type II secretion system protein, partial [Candidatus Paceibacterota bacterium]